jgi:hypothetical protein
LNIVERDTHRHQLEKQPDSVCIEKQGKLQTQHVHCAMCQFQTVGGLKHFFQVTYEGPSLWERGIVQNIRQQLWRNESSVVQLKNLRQISVMLDFIETSSL